MEWKKRENRKTRKTGGVLFTSDPDIMPELVRFTNNKIHILSKGPQAFLLELHADPSTILSNPCAIGSVILKIVAINKNAIFHGDTIEATPIKEFESEVHKHQDICERSVSRFGCSIAPTILHADVYTKEELKRAFPAIEQYANGTIGLIFMEHITYDRMFKSPTLYHYLQVRRDSLLSKARRLFIMLAQIGFLHNDFHLKNIVVTKPLHGNNLALLLIDFGRTSVIKPSELDVFQETVESYDASMDHTLKKWILSFLYRIEYKEYKPEDYPESFGWFLQDDDIADEVEITAPILLDDVQKKNCVSFQKIPYETRELLKRNGHLLKDRSTEERNNRILVLYAVANFGEALEYASEELRDDKETVMTAVTENSMALRFASHDMRADSDVLRIALSNLRNPRPLQYAIRPAKEFVLPHLRRDGLSLAYVTDKDTEMIMTAISQNGMALHYVDKRFQDKKMVMAAVSQNGMALEHAAAIMKATEEVVMAAVSQNGKALQYASAALRADEDVVLTAVLQDGRAIHFAELKTPKLLLYASLHGHTPTDEEIKLVLPFLDRYSSESEPHAKRQKVSVPFKERYKERIEEIEHKTANQIHRSIEKLNSCTEGPGNCTIAGGKNKKVMYGSPRTKWKSRRTRRKTWRTRRCKRNA